MPFLIELLHAQLCVCELVLLCVCVCVEGIKTSQEDRHLRIPLANKKGGVKKIEADLCPLQWRRGSAL